ncbi:MAG: hypothetical protein QOI80_1312 [Solirubrobacteraceae bacterium]|jgi:EmrB/QacA subfamily drug resistance transporter|nr:hypothetical protein [Solirubrobacteraceae bacterium]
MTSEVIDARGTAWHGVGMTDLLASAKPRQLTPATSWAPLLVVCSAAFVVVLDFFIVNVALPDIQADLGASVGAIEWVVAGYGLTLAVGLIAGGRLGDRYGRRRMFCLGLGLFTLASALCGLAPTPGFLVAGRLEQGAAAALLTPQILAIIGVTYAGAERLKALGVYGTTMGLAAVSGQLVGGALVSSGAGWRGCFLINLPIGIATLAFARRSVTESRVDGAPRPDLAGSALLAVGLLALLLPLVEGRQHGWPAWSIACLAAAPLLAGVFTLQQRALRRRGRTPLLDPVLLRAGVFARGLAAQLVLWCGQAAFFLVLALYLQQGRGLSAMQAGLVFTAVAGSYVAAAAKGPSLVERYGRRVVAEGGLALAVGHALLAVAVSRIGTTGSLVALMPGLLLVGLGMGLCIPALMGLLLAEVEPAQAGSAGGVLSTVQNVGNALGVAITGVVFFGAVDRGYGDAFSLSVAQLAGVGGVVAACALLLRPKRETDAT